MELLNILKLVICGQQNATKKYKVHEQYNARFYVTAFVDSSIRFYIDCLSFKFPLHLLYGNGTRDKSIPNRYSFPIVVV